MYIMYRIENLIICKMRVIEKKKNIKAIGGMRMQLFDHLSKIYRLDSVRTKLFQTHKLWWQVRTRRYAGGKQAD